MPDANRNENILINHLAQTKSLSIDRIKLESHSFLLCFGHRVDMSKGRKVAVMRRTKRHHVINGNRESFSSFLFSFPPRESFEQRFNTASLRVSSPRKKEISRLDESVEEKNGSRSPESSVATVCLSLSRGGKTGPRNAVYVDIFERI